MARRRLRWGGYSLKLKITAKTTVRVAYGGSTQNCLASTSTQKTIKAT